MPVENDALARCFPKTPLLCLLTRAPFILLYKDAIRDCGGDSAGQCLKGRRMKEPFETLVAPHHPTPTPRTPGLASRNPRSALESFASALSSPVAAQKPPQAGWSVSILTTRRNQARGGEVIPPKHPVTEPRSRCRASALLPLSWACATKRRWREGPSPPPAPHLPAEHLCSPPGGTQPCLWR